MGVIRNTGKSITDAEAKLETIKTDVAATDALITRWEPILTLLTIRLVGEIQDLEKARAKARDSFESFQSDSISAHKRILQMEGSRVQRNEILSGLDMAIRQLQESIRSLKG